MAKPRIYSFSFSVARLRKDGTQHLCRFEDCAKPIEAGTTQFIYRGFTPNTKSHWVRRYHLNCGLKALYLYDQERRASKKPGRPKTKLRNRVRLPEYEHKRRRKLIDYINRDMKLYQSTGREIKLHHISLRLEELNTICYLGDLNKTLGRLIKLIAPTYANEILGLERDAAGAITWKAFYEWYIHKFPAGEDPVVHEPESITTFLPRTY